MTQPSTVRRRRWPMVLLLCAILGAALVAILIWRLDLLMPYAKPYIEGLLSGALRRPVTIGELSPQIFPRAHILARRISTGDDSLRVAELRIDIPLSSLVKGEIELSSITLIEPRISLKKFERESDAATPAGEDEASSGNRWLAPKLGRVVIQDGTLESSEGLIRNIDAESNLTIDGALIRVDGLSGEAEAPFVGIVQFKTPALQYDRSLHTLQGEPLQIRVWGSDVAVKYRWNGAERQGEFGVQSDHIDVEPFVKLVNTLPGAALKRVRAMELGGTLAPDIDVTLSKGEWRTKGVVRVTGARFKYRDFPASEVSGTVALSGSAAGWELSSEALSGLLGKQRERAELRGRLSLPKVRGDVEVRGERVSWANLSPLLSGILPKDVRIQALTGSVTAKFGLGDAPKYDVQLTELSGEGSYRETPVRVLRGGLAIQTQAGVGAVTVREGVLEVGEGRESVALAGSLSFPTNEGTFRVKGETLSLPGLLRLAGVEGAQLGDASGTVGMEADVELQRGAISAKGRGQVAGLSLPNAGLRDTQAGFEFRPVEGGTRVELSGLQGILLDEAVSGRASLDVLAGEVILKNVDAALLGGTLRGEGAFETAGKRRLRLDVKGANFDSARLSRMLLQDPNAALIGRVSSVSGTLRGETSGAILPSLHGNLEFLLRDGLLKGIHLGRVALQKLDRLPLFAGNLYEQMSPELRAYFQGEDTPIRELGATLEIAGATVRTQNARLISDDFAVDGAGSYVMDGSVDINSRIIFSPEFSRALQAQVYEAKRIMTPDGLLILPLTITGPPDALDVQPDVQALIGQAAGGIIEKKAGELLEKFMRRR